MVLLADAGIQPPECGVRRDDGLERRERRRRCTDESSGDSSGEGEIGRRIDGVAPVPARRRRLQRPDPEPLWPSVDIGQRVLAIRRLASPPIK